MQFTIYARIPDADQRHELKKALRHHSTDFTEECDRISVEVECASYKTVERIVDYFDKVEHTERGFTLIGDKGG